MKFKIYLFFNDKMLEIERIRLEMFWEHVISHLIDSKVHNWTENISQMPVEVQLHFRSPKNRVRFCQFAFENSILLMQNSIFFKKIEISEFESGYFKSPPTGLFWRKICIFLGSGFLNAPFFCCKGNTSRSFRKIIYFSPGGLPSWHITP